MKKSKSKEIFIYAINRFFFFFFTPSITNASSNLFDLFIYIVKEKSLIPFPVSMENSRVHVMAATRARNGRTKKNASLRERYGSRNTIYKNYYRVRRV